MIDDLLAGYQLREWRSISLRIVAKSWQAKMHHKDTKITTVGRNARP
jgi:hypothetical protein